MCVYSNAAARRCCTSGGELRRSFAEASRKMRACRVCTAEIQRGGLHAHCKQMRQLGVVYTSMCRPQKGSWEWCTRACAVHKREAGSGVHEHVCVQHTRTRRTTEKEKTSTAAEYSTRPSAAEVSISGAMYWMVPMRAVIVVASAVRRERPKSAILASSPFPCAHVRAWVCHALRPCRTRALTRVAPPTA